MMRSPNRRIALLACAALLLGPGASATVFLPQATAVPGSAPQGFNYQGRLDNNGAPVTAPELMTFRLYDAASGGNLIWQSPTTTVQVNTGLFNAVVPAPIVALLGTPRYLEVQIGPTIMSPRELLNSVPYALIAKSVEGTIDVSTSGLSIVPNSLASTPSLTISSQTGNVGIGTSNPGAAFSVGASSLVVTSGGGVGIGTPSPKSGLDVGAGGLAVGAYAGASAAPANGLIVSGLIGAGTASPSSRLQIGDAAANTANQIILGRYETTTETNFPLIQQKSVLGAGAGNDLALAAQSTSGGIDFYTGNTGTINQLGTGSNAVRMAITAAGNVGIGTTSPGTLLDVQGASGSEIRNLSGGVDLRLNAGASTAGSLYTFSNHPLRLGTNNAENMRITTAGNVGIGTQLPAEKLEINGNLKFSGAASIYVPATQGILTLSGGGGGLSPGIRFQEGPNTLAEMYNNQASLLVYGLSASNFIALAARGCGSCTGNIFQWQNPSGIGLGGIDQSGNVGVGTTSPATALDVNGAAQFGSGATKSTFTAAGVLQLASPLTHAYGGTDVASPGAAGNLLLSNGANWASTTVSGDATLSGAGAVTLANTAVAPATYGDSTHVSQVTVDSKGRLTSAASVLIAGTSPSGSALPSGDVWVGNALNLAAPVALSGDVASVSNAGVVTLANTTVAAGTYGSSTQIPQITVDSKGRATGVSNATLTPVGTALTSGQVWVGNVLNQAAAVALSGDVASVSNAGAVTLANTAVAAGTYGSSTQVPQITVDSKGRATGVSNATLTPVGTALTSGQVWVGNVLNQAAAVALSGDVASVSNAGVVTLANTTVAAGTYNSVTVNAKGLVTAASNVGNVQLSPGVQQAGFFNVSGNSTNGGSLTVGGGLILSNQTIAGLLGIVPALGQAYYCSNCSPPKIVVATGTAAGNFADAVGGAFK